MELHSMVRCSIGNQTLLIWSHNEELIAYHINDNTLVTHTNNIKEFILETNNPQEPQLLCLTNTGHLLSKPIRDLSEEKQIEINLDQKIERIFKQNMEHEVQKYILLDSNKNAWIYTSNNQTVDKFMENCNFQHLSFQVGFTIALDFDGNLWSWGRNNLGQLGVGQLKSFIEFPTQVIRIPKIKKVSAGASFSVALDYDGHIYSFGFNCDGNLGLGHQYNMDTPALIENIPLIQDIVCGVHSSAALTVDNKIYVWGSFQDHEIILSPVCISNEKRFLQIETGPYMVGFIFLDFDGFLWSYKGECKQLSQNDNPNNVHFRYIKTLDAKMSALIDMDGQLYCIDWGNFALTRPTNAPLFLQNTGARTKSSRNVKPRT